MTISRRHALTIVLLLAGVLAYWLWPERQGDFRNFPPTAHGPWVAFGDSLTEGFGANAGGDYPTQLGQRLGVNIRNMGVSGETSADGLKRLDEVEALEPRVVLLCFGGNDVLRGLPRNEMVANISSMVDRLHARGSFVVLIGVRGSLVRDNAAKLFSQLAREKQVLHIPNILDGLLTQPSLMSDHVHPNDAGYARIADRIEEKLRPLLPELVSSSGRKD